MRDIQPMKFFGGISVLLGLLGFLTGGFVSVWYAIGDHVKVIENGKAVWHVVHRTNPFTSLIPISGALFTLSFLLFALALLADMLGRHRRISEELLYLARRRIYSNRRASKVMLPTAEEPHGAMGPTLHDSWTLPVMKAVPAEQVEAEAAQG